MANITEELAYDFIYTRILLGGAAGRWWPGYRDTVVPFEGKSETRGGKTPISWRYVLPDVQAERRYIRGVYRFSEGSVLMQIKD